VDEAVHDPLDGLDRLFATIGLRLVFAETDVALLFVGEDEGLIRPVEEIHQVLLVERQSHPLLLYVIIYQPMNIEV